MGVHGQYFLPSLEIGAGVAFASPFDRVASLKYDDLSMVSVDCRISPGTARLCGRAIATDLFDSEKLGGRMRKARVRKQEH
jgi:hypothetical protein